MILCVFSVFDAAAKAYIPPFILPNRAMGQRVFWECSNAPDHMFFKHPQDYSLYHVADFDDVTGVICGFTEPLFMISAKSLKGVDQ